MITGIRYAFFPWLSIVILTSVLVGSTEHYLNCDNDIHVESFHSQYTCICVEQLAMNIVSTRDLGASLPSPSDSSLSAHDTLSVTCVVRCLCSYPKGENLRSLLAREH